MLLTNIRLIHQTGIIENGWLQIEAGKIADFGASSSSVPRTHAPILDGGGLTLSAGYVDIHVHGGNGIEIMDDDPEAVLALAQFYAAHGVTGFLPTTWTADDDPIYHALKRVADAQQRQATETIGAHIWGAHVEGPYVNPNKAGAQNPHLIRRADMDEFSRWQSTGVIKLMTIAPEFEENLALIRHCTAHGIITSAGHTDATQADMIVGMNAGITNTTHTFNAMRPLHHRELGTVGTALLNPDLYCEIIPDGVHVHPDVVRLFYRNKGTDRAIIITDAVRGAGLSHGTTYLQDGRTVTVRDSAYLDDGTLAGSTLTMDVAVKNFMRFTGMAYADGWRCANLNAAHAIRIDQHTGSIATGKRADLILLDADLNVHLTMVGGDVVYRR